MAPLPALKSYLSHLLSRTALSSADALPSPSPTSIFNALSHLLPRDTPTPTATIDPSKGVTDPQDMHTKFLFILFGLIGASFVCLGIWFFFWARNGGFYYKEGDWEEYKSTVLRRKGPNGTTLSGATTATDLGGGSVVHGQKGKKEKGGGRSMWGGKKKEKSSGGGKSKKFGKKDKGKQEKYKDFEYDVESALGTEEMSEVPHHAHKPSKLRGGDLGNNDRDHDDSTDVHASVQEAMRAYRHEKPARVGGLNKESEASTWDATTNPTGSEISGTGSEAGLLKHKQSTPTNSPHSKDRKDNYTGGSGSGSPTKAKGGIRKVVSSSNNNNDTPTKSSFWSRNNKPSPQTRKDTKSEARKLQEKGRAATGGGGSSGRRDFSFQSGAPDDSTVFSEESAVRRERMRERAERRERERGGAAADGIRMPGSWDGSVVGDGSEVSGESGTKVYECFIPGLSGGGGGKRGGGAGNGGYSEERRKARGFRRDV